MILRILMMYYYIFHCLACIWFYIGYSANETSGWIYLYLGIETTSDNYQTIYLRSIYYIVQTFSTVGLGDYHSTDGSEWCFSMF